MKTIISLLIIALTLPTIGLAQDHNHQINKKFEKEAMTERGDHYHVKPPKTAELTFDLLKESLKNAQNYYKASEFEALHKVSYSLEASVDSLRSLKIHDENLLDELDEIVQIIHYASEKRDEKVLNERMPILERTITQIIQN